MTCRLEGVEMYGALQEIWITDHNVITAEVSLNICIRGCLVSISNAPYMSPIVLIDFNVLKHM